VLSEALGQQGLPTVPQAEAGAAEGAGEAATAAESNSNALVLEVTRTAGHGRKMLKTNKQTNKATLCVQTMLAELFRRFRNI
jgi:hypothetical protein